MTKKQDNTKSGKILRIAYEMGLALCLFVLLLTRMGAFQIWHQTSADTDPYTAIGGKIGEMLGNGQELAAAAEYKRAIDAFRADTTDAFQRNAHMTALQRGMLAANPRDVQELDDGGYFIDWATEAVVTDVLQRTEPICNRIEATVGSLKKLSMSSSIIDEEQLKRLVQQRALQSDFDSLLPQSAELAQSISSSLPQRLDSLSHGTFVADFRHRRTCDDFPAVINSERQAEILPPETERAASVLTMQPAGNRE